MRWRADGRQWRLERELAKTMRCAPTEAERVLWEQLRRRQMAGLRFRRQHVLGRFIVDFYCAERRLIVEVDGSVHDASKERDEERTQTLQGLGFTVVRVSNADVLSDMGSVLARIRRHLAMDVG